MIEHCKEGAIFLSRAKTALPQAKNAAGEKLTFKNNTKEIREGSPRGLSAGSFTRFRGGVAQELDVPVLGRLRNLLLDRNFRPMSLRLWLLEPKTDMDDQTKSGDRKNPESRLAIPFLPATLFPRPERSLASVSPTRFAENSE